MQPDYQSSQIYNAISAYAEELPAVVLAGGILTENDRLLAAAFGATLGEGPFFSSVDDLREPAGIAFAAAPRTVPPSTTPFDCDEATVVMSTFQKSSNLTANSIELYSALSRNLSYVFAFTHPVESSETDLAGIPDLRIHTFAQNDPLSLEWNVIILNARYQAMLVARENPASIADETAFDFVITHDRPTILRAAEALIPHI